MKFSSFEIILIAIAVFIIALGAVVIIDDVCQSPEERILHDAAFLDYIYIGVTDYTLISVESFKDVGGVDVVRYTSMSGEQTLVAYVMLEPQVLEIKMISSGGVYTRFDSNPVFVCYGGKVSLYQSSPTWETFTGLVS